MPKKIKQKQKQSQYQKVVVNVGEVKKRKRITKRRQYKKEPSQEAREYADAISKIIPKIQYNFPQHTSFNYDAYQTPNLVPQPRPTAVNNPIPLEQGRSINENIVLGQDFRNSASTPIFDKRAIDSNSIEFRQRSQESMSNAQSERAASVLQQDRYEPIYSAFSQPRSILRPSQSMSQSIQETPSPYRFVKFLNQQSSDSEDYKTPSTQFKRPKGRDSIRREEEISYIRPSFGNPSPFSSPEPEDQTPPIRRRGRPPGSKNKPKEKKDYNSA